MTGPTDGFSPIGGGPYFDDFHVGQRLDASPSLTLTDGHAAVHQSIIGSRLHLAINRQLSTRVTGATAPLAHPALVCDVVVGQSSQATQRGVANLYYSGLTMARGVYVGDTITTTTEVVGLKQNNSRPTGVVAMRMMAVNQDGEVIVDGWRCGMLPLRDRERDTGHHDDLATVGTSLDSSVLANVTREWDLATFRTAVQGPRASDLLAGTRWEVEYGDVVTSAPELVRLTGNVAAVHHDRTASAQGRRLVFGGHTIGLALAQASRAIPSIVTVVGWHRCDHVGPVHEGDTVFSTVEVEKVELLVDGSGLVHLRSLVRGVGDDGTLSDLLDWRFVVVVA